MQISLLCFVRTWEVPRHCRCTCCTCTCHTTTASPSSPRLDSDATAGMPPGTCYWHRRRGEHEEAAQPAFLPFPRHARVWHASRWLGIKKGLHIIRRPANLPGRFVPKCQPRWTCCARICTSLDTLSILAHPRLAVHWLYS